MASRLRLKRPPPAWLFPAAVVLVATMAAWPAIAQPGLLNTRGGGDSPFLLQRLHQLTAALADGHFPVRWMPDANYGYGYPFYNFYAPLSIYVAAAFRFLGFSFVRAIHLAQWSGFVVAGLAMFWLARGRLGSPWAGLLAAVAYTVAPFHMVNVYVRGDSLAEFWAMAFYPLVLLAADGLLHSGRQPTRRWPFARPLALFALAYAALILSHNISALIFSPFLLLYLVFRLWRGSGGAGEQGSRATGSPRASLLIVFGLLLAFALAAWFFVPALAEQEMAQLGPVTEGYFHYSNHFRGLDLVQGGLLFDYDPDGGRAFHMGLAQALLATAGGAVLIWGLARRNQPPVDHYFTLFLLAGFAVATLMITPLSRLLWEHLPLLSFTQFPWRFLSVQAFFAALLTGGLALWAERAAAPALALVATLVLLVAALAGLRVDYLILTDADVTAERLAQYEWFTGNIGTTISAEYLTPAAAPRPWTSAWLNDGDRDRTTRIAGELIAAALRERSATRQEWAVEAGPGGATVLLPTLYWPGWRAALDGQPVGLAAQPSSGLTTVAVPEGAHVLTLELGRTPVRAAAEWLSLIAATVALTLLLAGRRSAVSNPWSVVCGLSSLLLPPALALGLFALAWRNDPRELPSGDLTWDFAQMGYLHHSPGGVAFEGGARLYEYGYSAEEARPGSTLTITLSVAPGDNRAATLALVTPASARPTGDAAAPPVLVAATQPLDAETIAFTLPLPVDAPPGLYVPRLTLDGARPLMPSGGTRGDLFLRPVRVLPGDGPATGEALDVRATALAMRDATTLDGRFAWYTAQPLGSRYVFSWRLQDETGARLAQLDAQPGYGFGPSSGWRAGEWSDDWLALRLPDAPAAEGDYPLVMSLYDPTDGRTLLSRRVGVVNWAGGRWSPRLHESNFALPDDLRPTTATFGDGPLITLPGYRLAREGDTLRLTLYWQAAAVPGSFTRFVHLINGGGVPLAQSDGAPAGNSHPTEQWLPGEVVADVLTFDLSPLPAGEYRLAAGFYAPSEGLPRLPSADATGPLPDGRFMLPETISIQ